MPARGLKSDVKCPTGLLPPPGRNARNTYDILVSHKKLPNKDLPKIIAPRELPVHTR